MPLLHGQNWRGFFMRAWTFNVLDVGLVIAVAMDRFGRTAPRILYRQQFVMLRQACPRAPVDHLRAGEVKCAALAHFASLSGVRLSFVVLYVDIGVFAVFRVFFSAICCVSF